MAPAAARQWLLEGPAMAVAVARGLPLRRWRCGGHGPLPGKLSPFAPTGIVP